MSHENRISHEPDIPKIFYSHFLSIPIMEIKMSTDEYETIFVKFITLRNGKRLYASEVGKQAFPIRVRKKKNK